jgi:hypothetical protein
MATIRGGAAAVTFAGEAVAETPAERWLFRVAASFALALQLLVVLGAPGLHGGEDLVPHLRLIERMQEAPGLHNVYAPAYHVLGALLSPLVGLDVFPRLFALASAVALMAGFRSSSSARPGRIGRPVLPHAHAFSLRVLKIEAMATR